MISITAVGAPASSIIRKPSSHISGTNGDRSGGSEVSFRNRLGAVHSAFLSDLRLHIARETWMHVLAPWAIDERLQMEALGLCASAFAARRAGAFRQEVRSLIGSRYPSATAARVTEAGSARRRTSAS